MRRPDADGDAAELGDLIGDEDEGFARSEDRATIDLLLRLLSVREREILRLRLEEDLTQSEIGRRVGLSQMHVSRILRDALVKLRRAAAATQRAGLSGSTSAKGGAVTAGVG